MSLNIRFLAVRAALEQADSIKNGLGDGVQAVFGNPRPKLVPVSTRDLSAMENEPERNHIAAFAHSITSNK